MTSNNTNSVTTLTITRPDDWHVHLRDGDQLKDTVRDISRYMGRAIVMPNLVPPATCTDTALSYRERIMSANPQGNFEPLMVLYLTDKTTPDEIIKAKATGKIVAAKLYPAGATTNSDSGVTSVKNIYPVLKAMQEVGMLLLVHGEVTDSSIDIFDREKVFLDTILGDVVNDFPELKIVLEHITTKDAVEFVVNAPSNVAATITAHHLLYNRNHMLAGGIRPHYYCLPILKRNIHQQALMAAAISGNKKFFLGTDSAPHYKDKKEAACGCAGAYTAHAAIELYAEAFEDAGALDMLEGFASHFGPDFYELPRNTDTITLQRKPWKVPASYTLGDSEVVPIKAENTMDWSVE
ncbi:MULTISPECIES: dihydroorotase [Pseudoalteromonas]|jgi:dihydroorotase|uniref:dihydroorotase n=1 Tax=Pseudoalteromonas TaxID=53246 RepID=UPI000404CB2B|nr:MULTISPECIES: dihydroorotase [Pseudoalteromonas]MBB1276826.1 dihydroorotase [Pseudoalteromonas sp. SR43-3]MBB1324751.1 dihydroorotase [Pseudoalteromonas sp. SR45-1]MBB1329264.1 dihydroorotase [Pseudoalteromonas sp. SR43-7]MBB1356197.1 dihydroorotase [Pseudoalteromonas sp. SR45-5]MBB1457051.1 dihydroorotase [Pseudoalteromonas sp. SG43-5]|tara:strand:- start:268 stop:1320 length:1053 start_codon:yes stop_codon:yes gene_type:complete